MDEKLQAIDDWLKKRCEKTQRKFYAKQHENEKREALGEHKAYMAVRSFIHGTRNAG